MRVFVAGATGVIGRQLVPLLVADGHEVIAMTRNDHKIAAVRAMGADGVVADALDPGAVKAAVGRAEPDVVVHELTAIPARVDPRRFAEEFGATNRLRRIGTRNLVAAAVAAGARRVVAQSIAQAYKPVGSWIKTEEDPLYVGAPTVFCDIFDAIIELEATVLGAAGTEGVVLRYGNFYGPGTRFAPDGSDAELVRRRQFPIAGGGSAYWSFVHVYDAATATMRAVLHGDPGIYNIVDDEPAPIADWLPVYARALDAPTPPETGPPRSDYGIYGALRSRGASNAKAKQHLAWSLRYPSWRHGFIATLA
ncbi:MAG: NAD(P)-dependent oxidoreductase [Solirubrobacteraceae bacterium]